MADIATLTIEVDTDADDANDKLNKLVATTGNLESAQKSLASATDILNQKMKDLTAATSDQLDDMQLLAMQVGLSTGAMLSWSQAADKMNLSAGTSSTLLANMTKILSDHTSATASAREQAAALGVNLNAYASSEALPALIAIGDKLNGLAQDANTAAISQQLLGTNSKDALAALNDGFKELSPQQKQFNDFLVAMKQNQDDFNDSMAKAKTIGIVAWWDDLKTAVSNFFTDSLQTKENYALLMQYIENDTTELLTFWKESDRSSSEIWSSLFDNIGKIIQTWYASIGGIVLTDDAQAAIYNFLVKPFVDWGAAVSTVVSRDLTNAMGSLRDILGSVGDFIYNNSVGAFNSWVDSVENSIASSKTFQTVLQGFAMAGSSSSFPAVASALQPVKDGFNWLATNAATIGDAIYNAFRKATPPVVELAADTQTAIAYTTQQKDAWLAATSALDPTTAATKSYNDQLDALQNLLKNQIITLDQFNRLMAIAAKSFTDTVDPVGAYLRQLDDTTQTTIKFMGATDGSTQSVTMAKLQIQAHTQALAQSKTGQADAATEAHILSDLIAQQAQSYSDAAKSAEFNYQQQSAGLTLLTGAYGSSAAAGALAEAAVTAHAKALANPAINEGRQLIEDLTTAYQNATLELTKSMASIDDQTAAQQRLNDAAVNGNAALKDMQLWNQAVAAASKAAAAAMALGDGSLLQSIDDVTYAYYNKLKVQSDTQAQGQIIKETQSLQDQLAVAQLELDTIGQNPGQRQAEIDALKERQKLLAQGADINSQDAQTLIDLNSKLGQINGQVKEQQAAEQAMTKPFENAVTGIQNAFVSMFEGIFSGGVNSFKTLGDSILKIFIQLAAQIASLLVFKPVIGDVLSSVGLGSVAQKITGPDVGSLFGSSGGTSSAGGSSGGLFSNISNIGSGIWDRLTSGSILGSGTTNSLNIWGSNNLGIGNFNPLNAADTPGVGLGDILGAGGFGAIGGSVASLLGIAKNPYGGIAGGLAGGGLALAGLGSIAGPIGAAIGLIASLFGPSKPNVGASANFGFDNGTIVGTDPKGTHYAALGDSLEGQITALGPQINTILGQLGATETVGPSGYIGANNDGSFSVNLSAGAQGINQVVTHDSSVSQANLGLYASRDILSLIGKQALAARAYAKSNGGVNPGELTTGLSDTAATVLGSDTFANSTTQQDITDALTFIQQYDAAVKSLTADTSAAGQAQTQYQAALDAINTQFDTLEASANKYGLATDSLEAARQKEIASLNATKAATDTLNATFGDNKLSLQMTQWARAVSDAQNEVATAGQAATNAYQTQRNALTSMIQALDAASGNITGTQNSLLLGNLSPLNADQKQAIVAQQYFTTLNDALNGDTTALGNIGALSTQYLQAWQAGSGQTATADQYAQVFQQVYDNLTKANQVALSQKDIATSQLTTLDDSYAELVNIVNGVGDVTDAIKKLPDTLQATFNNAIAASQKLTQAQGNQNAGQLNAFNQLAGAVSTYIAQGGTDVQGTFGSTRDAILNAITDWHTLETIGETYYKNNNDPATANAIRAKIITMGGTPAFAQGGITSGPSLAGEAGPEAVIPLPNGRSVPVQLMSNSSTDKRLDALTATVQTLIDITSKIGTASVEALKGIGNEQHQTRLAIQAPG